MKKYQTILNLMKKISAEYYDRFYILDKIWIYLTDKRNNKLWESQRTSHNEDF